MLNKQNKLTSKKFLFFLDFNLINGDEALCRIYLSTFVPF